MPKSLKFNKFVGHRIVLGGVRDSSLTAIECSNRAWEMIDFEQGA
jgi:hypothetical protein